MTDQDRAERRSDWLDTVEMAELCGVSVATVKRRCEDGKPIRCRDGTLVRIESERITRPQGWEWRVRAMTAPPTLTERSERRSENSDQESPPPITSGAHSFNESALNILDMLLDSSLDAQRRQASRIEALIERAVRAEADAEYAQRERQTVLEALRTAQAALSSAQAQRDAERERADLFLAERDSLKEQLAASERAREAAERPWWRKVWGR